MSAELGKPWVALASRVLVAASRRNELFGPAFRPMGAESDSVINESPRRRSTVANARDARVTQK